MYAVYRGHVKSKFDMFLITEQIEHSDYFTFKRHHPSLGY